MRRPLSTTAFLIQSIPRSLDVCDKFQILAGRIIDALNVWNCLQHLVGHEWSILGDGGGEESWRHSRTHPFKVRQRYDCLLNVWQFAECLFCLHHHCARRINFDQIWQLRVIFSTLQGKSLKHKVKIILNSFKNLSASMLQNSPWILPNSQLHPWRAFRVDIFFYLHFVSISCIEPIPHVLSEHLVPFAWFSWAIHFGTYGKSERAKFYQLNVSPGDCRKWKFRLCRY